MLDHKLEEILVILGDINIGAVDHFPALIMLKSSSIS
jgi:hypothetical protein